jgi:hypothetical protein
MGYEKEGSESKEPWDYEWSGKNMTEEHKPEELKELLRIAIAGGKVMTKKNVSRVVWTRPMRDAEKKMIDPVVMEDIPFLNIARSLGDFWSWKESSQSYLVSF